MDTDHSGVLDKIEFRQVIVLLFGNIFVRVLIQWICTLLIVPYLATNAYQIAQTMILIARFLIHSCVNVLMFVFQFMITDTLYVVPGHHFITTSTPLVGSTTNNNDHEPILNFFSYLSKYGNMLANNIPQPILTRIHTLVVFVLLWVFVLPVIKREIDSIFRAISAGNNTSSSKNNNITKINVQ